LRVCTQNLVQPWDAAVTLANSTAARNPVIVLIDATKNPAYKLLSRSN